MKRFPLDCLPSHKSLLAGACLLWTTGASHALLINFDPPGYVANTNLAGNGAPGGTLWTTGGAALRINAGVGKGGSQGLILYNPSGSSEASDFVTSATDLPGFNPTSSQVRLGFSFRFAETPSSANARVNVGYLQIGNSGSSPAARITFYQNGTLAYHINRATPVEISSSLFQATTATTWYEGEVLLDYASGSYSFSVNDIELTDAGVFRGSGHNATMRFLSFRSEDHRQMVFDNVSLTVIPEPSAIALLLGGAGILLGFRKGRSGSC